MERHAEEAAVPEVVHVGAQVGERGRRRVREVVEHLDQPALLRDEDAPVGSEADDGGVDEPLENGQLAEAGCEGRRSGFLGCGRRRAARREQRDNRNSDQDQPETSAARGWPNASHSQTSSLPPSSPEAHMVAQGSSSGNAAAREFREQDPRPVR